MSYLKFDRNSMSNLEESLNKEILRTNRMGAYHMTSILGCNTRKYHGLLVVPQKEVHAHNLVLLSSFDETVIQHGAEFNLAVHKYKDGTFAPNGHKYIREFDVNVLPRTLYRVGGVILSKEVLFSLHENRILIRYTLVEAHSETTLRFRPLLAFRTVKELTHENSGVRWDYDEVPNGVSMRLYEGYPNLFMQFSKPVDWHFQPDWNRGLIYDKELERGHECTEDLPMPGFFECKIEKGESLLFSAGVEEVAPDMIAHLFEESLKPRKTRNSFAACLAYAADQFFTRRGDNEAYLTAGYPWFGVQARDQFISLTAATFGIGKPERFDLIMHSAIPALRRFMREGQTDSIIEDIDMPDVLLWVILCFQDLTRWRDKEKIRKEYGDLIREIMQYLLDNKHPYMKLRDNMLLYASAPSHDRPITWMNATIDGYPVVDRQGFIVEFNALWYNDLCFYRELFELEEQWLNDTIDRVEESFVRTFVNEHDYLFDYVVDDRAQDWNVRPNMIFASGLTFSPLSRKLQRSVLDVVTKELLTPKGLRTLSPVSNYYRGHCNGSLGQRAYASIQGGVWPWLMYFYLRAYMKLFRTSGLSFIERTMISFEDEMSLHGISTISEVYDPTPPFVGREAPSFLMSVCAIMRIEARLNDFYNNGENSAFNVESIYRGGYR